MAENTRKTTQKLNNLLEKVAVVQTGNGKENNLFKFRNKKVKNKKI